jgi:hypothetical protein
VVGRFRKVVWQFDINSIGKLATVPLVNPVSSGYETFTRRCTSLLSDSTRHLENSWISSMDWILRQWRFGRRREREIWSLGRTLLDLRRSRQRYQSDLILTPSSMIPRISFSITVMSEERVTEMIISTETS